MADLPSPDSTIPAARNERLPGRYDAPMTTWTASMLQGLACYYVTTLVFFLPFICGTSRVNEWDEEPISVWSCGAADCKLYERIARDGYEAECHCPPAPNRLWDVAFFPAYPLSGRWLAQATGWHVSVALAVLSHISLCAAACVLCRYCQCVALHRDAIGIFVVGFMCLVPTGVFFRVAYTESMFLFLAVLALYGIERRWPILIICLVAGLAAATRPVGLALVPAVAWHAWRTTERKGLTRQSVQALGAGFLAGWGLWVYMAFLWQHCGDPCAFVKAQAMSNLRDEYPAPLGRQLLGAIVLEPIWAVYVPSYHDYWARFDARTNLVVNLQFANPIYFVGTIVLIAIGWRKRWLTDYELLLSVGLLLIPYITKAHGNAMASFGRFALVVWPAYLVAGHILRSLPRPVTVGILAVLAALFTAYATRLAAGFAFV